MVLEVGLERVRPPIESSTTMTRSAMHTVADASSLSTLTVEELAELVAHSVVDRHNVLGLRVST